jgi:hypothetical protein
VTKTINRLWLKGCLVWVVVWTIAPLVAQTISTNDLPFVIPDYGGLSASTDGSSNGVTAGYATIQPNSGTTASGVAVVGLRQYNVLVDEFSIPAVLPTLNGLLYTEVGGSVDTGIVVANSNNQAALMLFHFTDGNGNDFGAGTLNVPANSQIALYLDQAPFNSGNVQGTFTFASTMPVAAVGLRLFTNERGDPLLTTLPVLDRSGGSPIVLAQFVDGSGWTTQVVLVNPGNTPIAGNIQFRDTTGQAATLTANSQTANTFSYSIPSQSSFKLVTAGAGSFVTGSIQVTPDAGTTTPMSQPILSFKSAGITTSSYSSWSNSGAKMRAFVESAGSPGANGSIQGGVAVANASSSSSMVTFSLTGLDGASQGSTSFTIAANGQVALFLDQLFPALPATFQGVLQVTSSGGLLSAAGLRLRYNERGDFLLTSAPPANASSVPSAATALFPYFANGGGLTSEFNLFSGISGQAITGHLRFYKQDGTPVSLTLSGLPKKRRGQVISQ